MIYLSNDKFPAHKREKEMKRTETEVVRNIYKGSVGFVFLAALAVESKDENLFINC